MQRRIFTILATAAFVWALLFAVTGFAGAQEETTLVEDPAEEQGSEPQLQKQEQSSSAEPQKQEVEAQAQAKLTIKKTDNPDPVAEGKTLTYKIVVENTGDATAKNVVVTDDLPDETTFVSAGTSRGTCPLKPNPGALGTDPVDVSCDIGNLPEGKSATVTIKVKPTKDAADAGTITNQASVTANMGSINKNTEEDTTVTPDLTIVKNDSPGTIEVGDLIRYTLTVENRGEANASKAVVRDQLPDKVEYVSSDADQGKCDEQPKGVVECDLKTINAGDSVGVEIHVKAKEAGDITNKAQVFAGDVNKAIDEDTEATHVESNGGGGNGGGGDGNNGSTGSSCPGAKVEETLTGTDTDETPKFHISGDSFRVKYNVTDVGKNSPLKISVLNENGSEIETQNVDQVGTDSFILNEGPGDFRVKVTATDADYTITIDDCTNSDQNGGGGGGGGGGGNTKAANNQGKNNNVKVVVVQPKQHVIKATIPAKVLPNTGGMPLAALALIGFGLLVAGVMLFRFVR